MKKTGGMDDATRAQLRWLCQHDLNALVTILNADNPDSKTGQLHVEMAQFAQTTPYRENLYLVSRGHLKTSYVTVGKNIQRLLNNPEIRILIGSNKAENAEGMLADIKGHLEKPLMIALFPEILWPDPARQAERWTNSAITVKRKRKRREATVETIGETGEITGRHYDHGTFDDLVGKENYQTRELREATKKFIRDVRPLFDPGTSTRDYVGTTWHYDDAYAWLLQQKASGARQMGTFIRPCWVADEHGTETPGYGKVRLTYPEKFTLAELLEIRAQGVSEFAAQYLINPLPADTAYFPRNKVVSCLLPRRDFPPVDDLWIVMAVDPAISTKAWADYSALAVVGFDAHGVLWLMDLRRGKWHESELVAQIYDAYQRIPSIQAVGFEAIGFQKIFRRLFTLEGERRGHYLPIVGLERDTKLTKNTRIRALEPHWGPNEIRFARECPALEDFLEEAERWRPDRENAHDDLLDAVVDTLQLRTRPDGTTPRHESIYDDPELAARVEWEQQAQASRRQTKAPLLDRTELRAHWTMAMRRKVCEEEREIMAAAGATQEFYG